MIYLLADPARAYYSTASVAEVPSNCYRHLSGAYGGPHCGDDALRNGLRQADRLGLQLMMLPVSALQPAPAKDVPTAPPVPTAPDRPLRVVSEPTVPPGFFDEVV